MCSNWSGQPVGCLSSKMAGWSEAKPFHVLWCSRVFKSLLVLCTGWLPEKLSCPGCRIVTCPSGAWSLCLFLPPSWHFWMCGTVHAGYQCQRHRDWSGPLPSHTLAHTYKSYIQLLEARETSDLLAYSAVVITVSRTYSRWGAYKAILIPCSMDSVRHRDAIIPSGYSSARWNDVHWLCDMQGLSSLKKETPAQIRFPPCHPSAAEAPVWRPTAIATPREFGAKPRWQSAVACQEQDERVTHS